MHKITFIVISQTKEGAKGQKVQHMKQTGLGKRNVIKNSNFFTYIFLSKIVFIKGVLIFLEPKIAGLVYFSKKSG